MGEWGKLKAAIATCVCLAGIAAYGIAGRRSQEHATASGEKAYPPSVPLTLKSAPKTQSPSPNVRARYNRLPLAFEPAQKDNSKHQFVAHGNGYAIFLRSSEARLVLRHSQAPAILGMELSGSNPGRRLVASEELPGKSNYILGNRPEEWRTNVPTYGKVTQGDIYPGIDVVYYGTQRELEYDFLVKAHANPGAVQLAFKGAEGLRTDSQGDLLITIAGSQVRLHRPVAYQEIDGEKTFVTANYILTGRRGAAFEVGAYDTSRALIIDPVLSYSTYLGGSNIDGANAIAVAPDNTAFVAGGTFSGDFPTAHALQANAGGNPDFSQDAFIAKISTDGSSVLYSTYLGGTNMDVANGIAVDTFGEAYVTGTTSSPDFPVTFGSWNSECGGDAECGATFNPQGLIVENAFVAKLNVAGSGLVYSTFLGEYEHVRGQAIAVDANENAYVTGFVEPNGVPTVTITPPKTPPPPFIPASLQATAFQPVHGGGTSNAFVAKLSATGTTLLYLSYLGGSNEDIGYGIAADNNGAAYLTGLTYSANFPLSAALQGTSGGAGDGFVTKVNTNASGSASLVFSSYLGGAGLDQGNGIALDRFDGTGNIYVTGTTNSSSLGVAANGVQAANKGQGDAFALKLTPSGTVTYFTFLGGSLADAGLGIAADASGNAYVTGSTVSADFPIMGSVFQKTFGGGNADAFVTKLDPAGATILYSTYLGGTNTDVGNGIAVDMNGSAYVAGQTCSQDFPLANPEQPGTAGNCDAFISKVSTTGGIAVNPAGLVFQPQSVGVTSGAQTIVVENTNDTASVAISSITISGDFAQTNSCSGTLAAGATCAISVTFHPTVAGIRKGAITITDNATGSPQVVGLTGSTSSVTLSASNLSFGTQPVGLAGPAQTVTVTNSGTTPLTISSITGSGDFTETNSCGTSLPSGTNCVITVIYKPSAPGQSLGAVTIADNAPGSPQSVLLTGTGAGQTTDFTISALPPSATVAAGTAAGYSLTVTPVGGFSQPVALSCGNLPRGASCSFSANPATTGGAPTTVTLTIATALRTFVIPAGRDKNPFGKIQRVQWIGLAALIGALMFATLMYQRRRLPLTAVGLAIFAILAVAGCNGGGQAGVPAGTPAGTYQVAVTATSGSLTHTATLNLQVN